MKTKQVQHRATEELRQAIQENQALWQVVGYALDALLDAASYGDQVDLRELYVQMWALLPARYQEMYPALAKVMQS